MGSAWRENWKRAASAAAAAYSTGIGTLSPRTSSKPLKLPTLPPPPPSDEAPRLRVPRRLGKQASISFAAGEVKVRYPTIVFSGCIRYCRTVPEVEQASMEILDKIRSLKPNKDGIPLGFDIKWRPIFRRGVKQRKVAVMQLCLENATCYVMHIFHTGIPPVLRSVLENDVFIKVGIAIRNDASKTQKDYNVSLEPLEDLSSLANIKLGRTPKRWSLGSLTKMIICKELPKPGKIRLGNWEAYLLSKEQLQYAATDAFLSWYLHQTLKGYPDAKSEAGNKEDAGMNKHP